MKAISSGIWSLLRAIGHAIWRFCSLLHNFDDVHEAYGDVPDSELTEQQLAARNLAANVIGSNGTGAY